MANRERGEVPIEIDGETYILRFSINECCDLEQKFDKSIIDIANMMAKPKEFKMGMVRSLFQVGLSQHHEMTERAAGDLLSKTNINDAMMKISEAFESAFPSGEDANPRKGKATAGRG